MAIALHQIAAVIYLAAAAVTGAGLAWPSARLTRIGVALLGLGALAHGAGFAAFHMVPEPPPLTDLPAAVSLMAWIAVLFFLALLWRSRLAVLVAGIAPVAALAAFFAAQQLPHSEPPVLEGSSSWPHAHVVLASAGIALLGVACIAGLAFLFEDRRLKAKRRANRRLRLPSLEALDRVNAAALATGFPLLTVGVLAGMMWVHAETGRPWTGTMHETWSVFAWGIYGVLVFARFRGQQAARQAALSAVAGFAFLFVAVIGVGLFA
jgi:ABC-type transport system involved in cytochrome c biogenesis permease subunit